MQNTSADINNIQLEPYVETRYIVIYGYTRNELSKILRRFESQLPEYVRLKIEHTNLVTRLKLSGQGTGLELLRFNMNRFLQLLTEIFTEDVIATRDMTIAEVLGTLLAERELTVSCAESCTGGNLAHRITEVPGSSAYFMGSVVSYSNDVKANVLNVPRADISAHGAVSRQVAEAMAKGVATLMRSGCSMSTTGIAGPDGGTKYKPVGTVWISAKYKDQVVSELKHFSGSRIEVIEAATDHAMVMLIKLLRNVYVEQEDVNDD